MLQVAISRKIVMKESVSGMLTTAASTASMTGSSRNNSVPAAGRVDLELHRRVADSVACPGARAPPGDGGSRWITRTTWTAADPLEAAGVRVAGTSLERHNTVDTTEVNGLSTCVIFAKVNLPPTPLLHESLC